MGQLFPRSCKKSFPANSNTLRKWWINYHTEKYLFNNLLGHLKLRIFLGPTKIYLEIRHGSGFSPSDLERRLRIFGRNYASGWYTGQGSDPIDSFWFANFWFAQVNQKSQKDFDLKLILDSRGRIILLLILIHFDSLSKRTNAMIHFDSLWLSILIRFDSPEKNKEWPYVDFYYEIFFYLSNLVWSTRLYVWKWWIHRPP